jgi:hypothetical protein
MAISRTPSLAMLLQGAQYIPTFKIDPATLFRLPGTAAHGLDKKKHPFFRVGHP